MNTIPRFTEEQLEELKKTEKERVARLKADLQRKMAEARDLFDEADFIRDLMRPIEFLIDIPDHPIKLKFCRLSSDEAAELRKRVDENHDLSFSEELVIVMVKKAYPRRKTSAIRKFLKQKIPTEIASYLARELVTLSSVFLSDAQRQTLRSLRIGSTTIPGQEETPSSEQSGDSPQQSSVV